MHHFVWVNTKLGNIDLCTLPAKSNVSISRCALQEFLTNFCRQNIFIDVVLKFPHTFLTPEHWEKLWHATNHRCVASGCHILTKEYKLQLHHCAMRTGLDSANNPWWQRTAWLLSWSLASFRSPVESALLFHDVTQSLQNPARPMTLEAQPISGV